MGLIFIFYYEMASNCNDLFVLPGHVDHCVPVKDYTPELPVMRGMQGTRVVVWRKQWDLPKAPPTLKKAWGAQPTWQCVIEDINLPFLKAALGASFLVHCISCIFV